MSLVIARALENADLFERNDYNPGTAGAVSEARQTAITLSKALKDLWRQLDAKSQTDALVKIQRLKDGAEFTLVADGPYTPPQIVRPRSVL